MDTPVLVVLVVLGLFLAAGLAYVMWRVSRRDRAGATPGSKTRVRLGGLGRVWGTGLGAETWERLEEVLLTADVGVGPTTRIVDHVRQAGPAGIDDAKALLAEALIDEFEDANRSIDLSERPSVVLVVGVNGSGKTTSIAKLAHMLETLGKKVVLGAADTFRAGAGEQLSEWADRVGVHAVLGQQGGDPASVAFDAVASAKARRADVVIIDTAGRLHGKKDLMAELEKIWRVVSAEAHLAETLLVLDATSGQNALAQVSEFANSVPLTGILLTKLDGTAKGGIVVAVESSLGVPVKFVGVGEGVDDLQAFDPAGFVSTLLEES